MHARYTLDLDKLTEFNPAIVYCFDTEGSRRIDVDSFHYILNDADQHEDVYRAYMYAQETILPWIRSKGVEAITPPKIIEWIKAIHLRIANRITKNDNTVSGEYAASPVVRPKLSFDSNINMISHVLGAKPLGDIISELDKFGISEAETRAIIEIYKKYGLDESISIERDIAGRDSNTPNFRFFCVMRRMAVASNSGKITASERQVLDQFIKFCMPPEKYEAAMQAFAERLCNAWKWCNEKNLYEVIGLIYKGFFGLTEIHPFVNGNGRTATCLVNIILRSFDYPSIIIRKPGENEVRSSRYTMAIADISRDPSKFQTLIELRIKEALERPYSHDMLKAIIPLRINLSNLILDCVNLLGEFGAEKIYERSALNTALQLRVQNPERYAELMRGPTLDSGKNEISRLMIQTQIGLLRELVDRVKASKTLVSHSSITNSNQSKQALKNALSEATGMGDWAVYANNCALITVAAAGGEEMANALIDALNQSGAANARLQQRKSDKVKVVYLENLQVGKLKNMQFAVSQVEKSGKNVPAYAQID